MGNVGLLYVGAVLFINGLMLIGVIPGKSAAILNFFVGGMQVIFPTIILIQANNDPGIILGAAGLYLFGFTYLYVGILQLTGLSGEGLGWFSLFVSVCAVVIGFIQLTLDDPVFAVIWWIWAVLWFLFFLLLGLNMDSLTLTTGWFTILISHLTGTIPAFVLLLGRYESNATLALALAALGALALAIAVTIGRRSRAAAESEESTTAPVVT
ncbi:transporter [Nesterenkonia sp. E16_7]|uniref:AmiS/UreI family transporter n=1 Tax=unclassified Nesterenkonia TaxID=2629769 RepID=UPI001A9260B0|nr:MULTISPECIES: AmiS/UreI family transporter [unclassified Nesterenkonia]MBO0595939.1 transporter [Nesterenkonia sp. E16_10]MBO0599461.1 transporter [Nesterenkonia sp. E16_7]